MYHSIVSTLRCNRVFEMAIVASQHWLTARTTTVLVLFHYCKAFSNINHDILLSVEEIYLRKGGLYDGTG